MNSKSFFFLPVLLAMISASAQAETSTVGFRSEAEKVQMKSDAAADKNFNLEVEPPQAALGVYTADFYVAVGEHITLGPSATLVKSNFLWDHYDGYMAALKSTIYLSNKRFMSSWVLMPAVGYASVKHTADQWFSDSITNETKGIFGSLMGGYQWNYRNGINITLAGGAVYYASTDTADNGSSLAVGDYTHFSPQFIADFGFAF
jgi:hypothetical protein